jgi:hypothetical protein
MELLGFLERWKDTHQKLSHMKSAANFCPKKFEPKIRPRFRNPSGSTSRFRLLITSGYGSNPRESPKNSREIPSTYKLRSKTHGSMLDRNWEILFDRDLGALRKGYTNCEEKEGEGEDDDDATGKVSAL